jgi:hypothetical protein
MADSPVMYPKVGKRIRTRRSIDLALDRAESKIVKWRSEGRCEVFVFHHPDVRLSLSAQWRCPNPATEVHHMIGGNGRKGRGISACADRKQHVCHQCHVDITGGVGGKKLIRIGGMVPHFTDAYERRGREHEG